LKKRKSEMGEEAALNARSKFRERWAEETRIWLDGKRKKILNQKCNVGKKKTGEGGSSKVINLKEAPVTELGPCIDLASRR